jgi:hypothetical protein
LSDCGGAFARFLLGHLGKCLLKALDLGHRRNLSCPITLWNLAATEMWTIIRNDVRWQLVMILRDH